MKNISLKHIININPILEFLERIFPQEQGVSLIYISFFPLLAQSFLRAQFMPKVGLGRIQNGGVLLYCEYLNLGRIRRDRKKESPKNEQKPRYDTKLTKICKTKPILTFKNEG